MFVSFIIYIVLRQDATCVRVDSPLQLYCSRNIILSMFQTEGLGSLKLLCQMDHQINISPLSYVLRLVHYVTLRNPSF